MQLQDKAVFVTGASRGLGRTLAITLAHKGARLAICARDAAALNETVKLCRAAATRPGAETCVFAVAGDITDAATCKRMMDEAAARLGGLDLLVLNAGLSMWAHFEEISDLSLFEELMRVNYLGAVYCVHAALPHLLAARGKIVAVSSAQAWSGMPFHTGYAAAKSALQGFLDSLAMEMGDRISILGIYPGWIRDTDLRASALGGDGKALGDSRRSHSSLSVTSQECSDVILKAVEREWAMAFIPRSARLLYFMRPIAYPLIKWVLGRAAHSQKETG